METLCRLLAVLLVGILDLAACAPQAPAPAPEAAPTEAPPPAEEAAPPEETAPAEEPEALPETGLSGNAGDDADAGWAFMEHFMSPEAQEILAGVGHISAITAVEVTDPMMQQAVAVLNGRGVSRHPRDERLLGAHADGAQVGL